VAPTYERTDSFKRDLKSLSPEDRQRVADKLVGEFVHDLSAIEAGTADGFRRGLRVKPMQGHASIWEVSWADDGRATFEYGQPVREGMKHIVWRRIGGHEIFGAP
jgi:hypothetical protein